MTKLLPLICIFGGAASVFVAWAFFKSDPAATFAFGALAGALEVHAHHLMRDKETYDAN